MKWTVKWNICLIDRQKFLFIFLTTSSDKCSFDRIMTKANERQSTQYFCVFSFTVVCPTVARPNNGIMIGEANSVGSTLRFICNIGYRLVGSDTIQCLSSGRWNPNPPFCTGIDLHTFRYNESSFALQQVLDRLKKCSQVTKSKKRFRNSFSLYKLNKID